MKIVVTGGFGYVGGRIVQHLAALPGVQVVATGRTDSAARAKSFTGVEGVDLDILSSNAPAQASTALEGADAVVHLISLNEIEASDTPELALKVRKEGTQLVLDAAIDAGVKRFVNVSTAHVYGTALQGTVDEQTPAKPTHPYAIAHKAAEELLSDASGIEVVTLRLSNGIGCPATPDVNRWTLVGNDLCRQVAERGAIELKSSGRQWRDFICLGDVARSVEHVLQMDAKQIGDGVFNLGGGNPMRIIDLAELISRVVGDVNGRRADIIRPEPSNDEQGEALDYRGDLLATTGFQLNGDLQSEIADTIKFCQHHFTEKGN